MSTVDLEIIHKFKVLLGILVACGSIPATALPSQLPANAELGSSS